MYVTYTLIIINFIIFIFEKFFYNYDKFIMLFGLNNLCFYGFYWQILTSFFLHGSLAHISMNMLALFELGKTLEKFLSSKIFLLCYMIGGLLTSSLSLIFVYFEAKSYHFINVIGASGAICVLIGMLSIFSKNDAKRLFILILVISFVPLLLGFDIAWFAHLIGYFIGVLFGWLFLKFKFFKGANSG